MQSEARLDQKQQQTSSAALGFHLWAMTKAERSRATVRNLRKRLRYLSDLSDAEIARVIQHERGRRFIDPATGAVS